MMALDNKSPEYQTFLEAVKNGRTAEVEQHLAEHPEFLDLVNEYGGRPLHFAVQNGHDSMVNLLLQHGSKSLDSPNKYGRTALHWAVDNGRNSTVELLLQHGSTSLDSPTTSLWTPLYVAARNGRYSTMTILKAVGAITLSRAHLNQEKIAKLQAPIPEDEVLEIRYRIYFRRSLLAQLLF